MRLAAAAVTLCLLAGPGSARELFVLRWSQPSQLAALDTERLVTRYIAPGIAVVEADSAALPRIAALGFDIAASGTAGAGEAWYLSDHLHYPLPPGRSSSTSTAAAGGCRKSGKRTSAAFTTNRPSSTPCRTGLRWMDGYRPPGPSGRPRRPPPE